MRGVPRTSGFSTHIAPFIGPPSLETRRKQPYAVALAGDAAMPFAGLWEHWVDHTTGEVIESCTIITCPANELISPLHNRMPVILPQHRVDRWLDPETPVAELQAMLVPLSAEGMETYPVTKRVNDPRNDDADCLRPATDGELVDEPGSMF